MLSDEESSLSEEMNEHNDISVKQPNSLILVNPNMNKVFFISEFIYIYILFWFEFFHYETWKIAFKCHYTLFF